MRYVSLVPSLSKPQIFQYEKLGEKAWTGFLHDACRDLCHILITVSDDIINKHLRMIQLSPRSLVAAIQL